MFPSDFGTIFQMFRSEIVLQLYSKITAIPREHRTNVGNLPAPPFTNPEPWHWGQSKEIPRLSQYKLMGHTLCSLNSKVTQTQTQGHLLSRGQQAPRINRRMHSNKSSEQGQVETIISSFPFWENYQEKYCQSINL